MKRAYKIQEFVAHTGNVNCVKIGKKTSRVLVTGGEDSKVNMWAVGKPNPILSLSGHSSAVESVTFDVTESLVVAGAASGTIKLWDLEEARIVRTLTGHRSNCTALDFHPFGEFFASGSLDTNLKVWDVRRKGCIHTYKGHTKGVNSVRFSPDGRWVVSGGEDNVVKLWDLTAGKLIHEFKHHDGQVQCLDFHPQEFLLATGSADRTVKFVDLETFATIGCAGPEPTGVRSLVFHPDGQTVLYGLHETLKVYSWEPLRCHDVVEVGWSKLADLSISEGKLLGCSYNQSCVGVWVVDLAHVAPHGAGVARGFGSPRSSFSFRSPKLLTSRDLQQVGEGITRIIVDREQPSEQVKEVTKVTTGRDLLSRHVADGLTRQNFASRPQQADDAGIRLSISKEMKASDILVQQEQDDTSKLSASEEFPVQQVRNGAEKISSSRDSSTKLVANGGNIVYTSNESVLQQVSDRGKIIPDSREQSTQPADDEAFSKGRSHHPQPGEDAKVVHVTEQATVQVIQEDLKDVAHQHTADDEKHTVTGRDCTVQQANDSGGKVASIREQVFLEPSTRLSSSKDNFTDQTNDGSSKVNSIREQLVHESVARSSTVRDHQTQPANGSGSRVSSIKEILFPERPNNTRDNLTLQASDGGVKVSSIRETLFPDSGNRLNNRDPVPRHLGTGDARRPSDIVVKRPVAFEVMNSSPRVSQIDSFKPSTPTRGIVKVEDHSFLIGGARSALSKGSAFQNGGKGSGADAEAFGSKGRLERTYSSGENGLKPLGLDMNAFAPKGSLTDRSDSSVNDVDLIKELMQQHQTVSSILLSRLTNMQVVQRFLARDDLKGAVEALAKVADPSVLIDVVNVLMAKCDSFTLEICSMLLPSINELLTSEHEKYLLTGVALLSMLVTSFGSTIHSTRVAPPAVGVDLEAERRQECCKVCYEKLQSIRQSLVPLTRRGGQLAKAAHDLSTSLDEI